VSTPGRYHEVTSDDGTRLCVYDAGNGAGPPILFIHGFAQSHLAWNKQFTGPLAAEFRLVAFDLRGHGWSDKPLDAAAYRDGRKWAQDVRAVIGALDLAAPVLVGWSYGGGVVCDLLTCGDAGDVAGINFVAGVVGDDPAFYGPDARLIGKTASRDPRTALDASRRFVRACFAGAPPREDFERMLAYNAMLPQAIRPLLLGRRTDARAALAALEIPVLFSHGSSDGIIAPEMSAFGARTVAAAQISTYEGSGHSPFYEANERFDRELAEFVRTCAVHSGRSHAE
jgi:pimeloyl-ACP methyl ester carboxylesterase